MIARATAFRAIGIPSVAAVSQAWWPESLKGGAGLEGDRSRMRSRIVREALG